MKTLPSCSFESHGEGKCKTNAREQTNKIMIICISVMRRWDVEIENNKEQEKEGRQTILSGKLKEDNIMKFTLSLKTYVRGNIIKF